jgi:Terminase large subunit, T4likevirus-type, N-terminal
VVRRRAAYAHLHGNSLPAAQTKGLAWTTFTPLLGMSGVAMSFLETGNHESRLSKYVVQAAWKDVPHLDDEEKRKLVANTPPYQIKARTQGEPALGAGAIYHTAEAEITVPDRAIPHSWPRAFGMDVGWNRTAVVWGARDPGSAADLSVQRTLSGSRRAGFARPSDP